MREQQMYGINWRFGAGSQASLIPTIRGPSDIMLAMHSQRGRAWAVADVQLYEKALKKNRGLYEVILDRKRKVYFDVDAWDFPNTLTECISKIKEVLPDAQLNISGSVEDTSSDPLKKYFESGKTTKYSYHITVDNYHLDNTVECVGLKGFCKENESLGFDWKVYTNNRQMKCIGQSKPKRKTQTYVSGTKGVSAHSITGFFNKDSKNAYDMFSSYEEISGDPKITYNRIKQKRDKCPDIDIYKSEPVELVKLIPNTYEHKTTFTVGLYYYKLGFGFDKFWEWAHKKSNDEDRYHKWKTIHWPKVTSITASGKNYVSKESIIKILERTYPNIRKEYYTKLFLDYSEVPIDTDIGRQYLNKDDVSGKLIDYLVTPMGSGKTKAVVDHTKGDLGTCIVLNCRVSLAKNISSRLPEKFINYQDQKSLRKLCRENGLEYKSVERKEIRTSGVPLVDNLCTTPNSLHYIGTRNYDTVIIDEFEMFQTAWTSVDTHTVNGKSGKVCNFTKNWDTTVRLLQNAKKIIIMDAFPSKNTLLFMSRLGFERSDINIIGSTWKYPELKIVRLNKNAQGVQRNSIKKFIKLIIDKLKNNKKLYVFWPYKSPGKDPEKLNRLSQMQLLRYIEGHVGRDLNYRIYNADENKDKNNVNSLKNVNEDWVKMDIILVNQAVTIGVNFDVKDTFDSVFLADASFVSNRELLQTCRRVRHLTTNTMYYVNLGGCPMKTYNMVNLPNDPVVRANVKDVNNEKKSKNETTTTHMFEKSCIKFSVDDEDRSKLPRLYKRYLENDSRYQWDLIEDIESPDAYERLCMYGVESVEDFLKCTKYRFRRLFNEDIPEWLIGTSWDCRNLVFKIKEHLKDSDMWTHKLLESLKVEKFQIPPKIKLADDMKLFLTKNFSYSRINLKKTSDMYLVSEALNNHFGYSVYSWVKDTNKFEMSFEFLYLMQTVYDYSVKIDKPMFV